MPMLDRLFGPPSRESFARLVMAGVRRAGEHRKIHFDLAHFCLRPEDDDVSVLNLANVYAEFCAASKELRPKLLSNLVRSWFADRRSLPETFGDVHPDLLPILRSRAYFDFATLQLNTEGHASAIEYPQQVLAEHLAIGLVYDLPDSMRTIIGQDLENWCVTFYEALESACANLRQKEDPVFVSPHDGVYISATGDNYDASRLILTDMVHQFDVRGDLIAMVLNRDTLVVTGSESLAGLTIMSARARQALREPRPISTIALRLVDDEWEQWLPPAMHSLHGEYRSLRLQTLGQQYAEQKQLLEVRLQKSEEECFVASFSAAKNSHSGALQSYCVWSDGIQSLLPKTDVIYFYQPSATDDKSGIVAMCRWETAEREFGSLLEPQDLYPPRYRTRSFPAPAQLRGLSD